LLPPGISICELGSIRHCEPSEAIQSGFERRAGCFAASLLAMTAFR
jgi:hypothetical protein